jgi:hypothetical protein
MHPLSTTCSQDLRNGSTLRPCLGGPGSALYNLQGPLGDGLVPSCLLVTTKPQPLHCRLLQLLCAPVGFGLEPGPRPCAPRIVATVRDSNSSTTSLPRDVRPCSIPCQRSDLPVSFYSSDNRKPVLECSDDCSVSKASRVGLSHFSQRLSLAFT